MKEVRGLGLMWGLDLNIDAAPVVPAGLARGVIVNRTAETVVRLLPPLTITEAEVDRFVDGFADVMDDAHRGSGLMWDFGKSLIKQARTK